jgi:hypothetical protein
MRKQKHHLAKSTIREGTQGSNPICKTKLFKTTLSRDRYDIKKHFKIETKIKTLSVKNASDVSQISVIYRCSPLPLTAIMRTSAQNPM